MGRASTITRRAVLIGSAAIAGGVAFGTYLVKRQYDNPLQDTLGEGEAAITPWVKIDRDKVTLITPHVELGQGTLSMQAALIAEELDLDFGQFETSPGVPAAAYYNTVIGDELAPVMSRDESWTAEAMRDVFGGVVKVLGVQSTGGSSSVPDSFDKLRTAGAVARETLKLAASKTSGVPVARLKTAEGAVHLPDGTALKYTELAEIAATLDPVEAVTLRGPSQWRLIGETTRRLDIAPKSTGALKYGIDLDFDGMVHATVRTNPRRGGELKGHDATAAEKMRGVIKIVPVTRGVAVVADNTWRAFQAADAITFEWGLSPYPAEMDAHWKAVKASFVPDRLDREWRNEGAVDDALGEGEPVSLEYRAPYVAHAPLEPLAAVIKVTDARVDVWASHQLPRFVQQKVAAVTGHDPDAVHFHNQYAGGSFGHRLEFEQIEQTAQVALAMKGVPVKLTYSREEDFAQDFPRQIAMARARGTVKGGRVEAFDLSIASVSVTKSQAGRLGQPVPGPDGQIAAGAWDLPYAIPNFRVRAYMVPELAPVSSWRSVGASTAGFFAECALDELIHAAGADPLEERLRLMNDETSRKVLEAVAEMSGWGADPGERRGRGVAFVTSFGVPTAEVVEVTATDDGIRIDKVFVAADVGQVVDPVNFENQVMGAVVWGLGHAMNCEITYSDGMAEQSNYHAHEGMRLHQCPEIIVKGLQNAQKIRGIGEPPVPPAAPALANAIFAATGTRLPEMPFNRHIDFV